MKCAPSFILLLLCYCSHAQSALDSQGSQPKIIGQCMEGTSVYARLAYEVNDHDTAYILSFRNQHNNFSDYHSIEFSGDSRSVEQLYAIIKQMIEMRNRKRRDYSVTLALGNKLIVVATTRILGVTSAIVYLPEGYTYLTERQLNKVFGKT